MSSLPRKCMNFSISLSFSLSLTHTNAYTVIVSLFETVLQFQKLPVKVSPSCESLVSC